MIRVRAASRLHFGLFAPPPDEGPSGSWPNALGQEVLPARRFGGVGLMVQLPGLEVTAEPAPAWAAEGPLAERALAFAQQFARALPQPRPHRLVVTRCAPEHAGLGTGTQLGLAVARALAAAHGLDLGAARWLVEQKGAILIGADTSGLEWTPGPKEPPSFIPVHRYLLTQQGVHIGEFHYLEDLARDRVYEFCYVCTTNKIRGTTAGFCLRPIALR